MARLVHQSAARARRSRLSAVEPAARAHRRRRLWPRLPCAADTFAPDKHADTWYGFTSSPDHEKASPPLPRSKAMPWFGRTLARRLAQPGRVLPALLERSAGRSRRRPAGIPCLASRPAPHAPALLSTLLYAQTPWEATSGSRGRARDMASWGRVAVVGGALGSSRPYANLQIMCTLHCRR